MRPANVVVSCVQCHQELGLLLLGLQQRCHLAQVCLSIFHTRFSPIDYCTYLTLLEAFQFSKRSEKNVFSKRRDYGAYYPLYDSMERA